jgi:hypothetical protein
MCDCGVLLGLFMVVLSVRRMGVLVVGWKEVVMRWWRRDGMVERRWR